MRKRRAWIRTVSLSACVVLAASAAACGNSTGGSASTGGTTSTNGSSSTTSGTSTPFRVLDITAQSGPIATIAKAQVDGLQAAANYLNAHGGGILGHKIVITIVNDNGSATTAVSDLLSYLSSHPKPNEVDDGEEGTVTSALLPVVASHNLLSFGVDDSAALLADGAKYPDQFLPQDEAAQLPAVVLYLKNHNYTNVGLLQEDDADAAAETPIVTGLLKSDGITYHQATFPESAVTVTSQLSALKADGAQAVIAEVLGPAVGYAIKARTAVGWTVPIIGDPAFSSTAVATLVPASDLKNVFAVVYPDVKYEPPATRSTGVKALLAQLTKDHALPLPASINVASILWDGLMNLEVAAKQAGSITQAKLVAALNHLNKKSTPLYATYPQIYYTPTFHENIYAKNPSIYPIVQEGPVSTGMVKSAS